MRNIFRSLVLIGLMAFTSCSAPALIATAPEAAAVKVGDVGQVWLVGIAGSATCTALSGKQGEALYFVGGPQECTIEVDFGSCQWREYAPGSFACRCDVTVTGVTDGCAGVNTACCWSH